MGDLFPLREDVEIQVLPKGLVNPFFSIIMWFILLLPFIIFIPLKGIPPLNIFIFMTCAFIIGCTIFIYYIRHFFRNSVFLDMTPEKLNGYNHFKKFKGEIRWDEIVEMYSTDGTYYIMLKDIHGRILRTSAPLSDFNIIAYNDENGNEVKMETGYHNYEILLNEMIRRAVNCKKIDFRTIRKKFPRISIYEKGL